MAVEADFLPAVIAVNSACLIATAVDWRRAVGETEDERLKHENSREVASLWCTASGVILFSLFMMSGLLDWRHGWLEFATIGITLVATTLVLTFTGSLFLPESIGSWVQYLDDVNQLEGTARFARTRRLWRDYWRWLRRPPGSTHDGSRDRD